MARGQLERGRPAWRGVAALLGLAAILIVAVAVVWLTGEARRPPGAAGEAAAVRATGSAASAVARRETRPTLDPARFVGKARAAHQVAREIPDVLDRLYCYCECDKSRGHTSLLSCYTDGHAAT